MAQSKKKSGTKKAQTEQPEFTADTVELLEVKPVKKRKMRYLLLYIAAIGFAFYAIITIINQNVRIAEKKAELSELQQQINVVEIQSKYLEKVRGYTGDELSEYMEKIAKEELGYVGEGERIFINVAGDQ